MAPGPRTPGPDGSEPKQPRDQPVPLQLLRAEPAQLPPGGPVHELRPASGQPGRGELRLPPRRDPGPASRGHPRGAQGGGWGCRVWGRPGGTSDPRGVPAEPSLSRQVVDARSLLDPLPRVRGVSVSRTCWRRRAGPRPGLQLSCTLHWSYPQTHARCFRIHCRRGTGGGPSGGGPRGLEEPTFLGLAFINQYRVVGLAVAEAGPGQEGRVEFLVEPDPREGFLVPRDEWGRATLLYSSPSS